MRPSRDSARRSDRHSPDVWRRGFTLLEVLITIALIGLLSAVLITGTTRLLTAPSTSPEDIFKKTVNDARRQAVETNQDVRLSFDSKEKHFTLAALGGVKKLPIETPNKDDLGFEFLVPEKGQGAILLGGELVETRTVPYVTFYPDGSCSPFRLQLRTKHSARVIEIDPWTCAPILESEKQ